MKAARFLAAKQPYVSRCISPIAIIIMRPLRGPYPILAIRRGSVKPQAHAQPAFSPFISQAELALSDDNLAFTRKCDLRVWIN